MPSHSAHTKKYIWRQDDKQRQGMIIQMDLQCKRIYVLTIDKWIILMSLFVILVPTISFCVQLNYADVAMVIPLVVACQFFDS